MKKYEDVKQIMAQKVGFVRGMARFHFPLNTLMCNFLVRDVVPYNVGVPGHIGRTRIHSDTHFIIVYQF